LLGLATLSVGVWLITRAHDVTTTCGSNASPLTGAGLSSNCMNIVSSYCWGFALAVGGPVIMMLALFAMVKREHRARRSYVAPAVHHLHDRDAGTLRDVA
jgi:cytochrome P450